MTKNTLDTQDILDSACSGSPSHARNSGDHTQNAIGMRASRADNQARARRMMQNWMRFLICLAVGLTVLIAPVAYQLNSGVEISGAQRVIMVMGAVGLGWFLTGRM